MPDLGRGPHLGSSADSRGHSPRRDETIARLRAAIDAHQPGTLFDEEAEEHKKEVRGRALRLLNHRARSRSELRDRLLRLDFEPTVVDAVLTDLGHAGLVDDRAFAEEWVRQRSRRRGKSTRVLDMELRRKGVGEEDRAAALAQVSEEDQEDIAREIAQKKARVLQDPPTTRVDRDKALRRIVGALARRGFPEGLSIRLAKEALAARLQEL